MWPLAAGVVEFPTGRRVRGRALRSHEAIEVEPDSGAYLLGHEPPPMPWPSMWIKWPDFRLPADPHQAIRALADALRRAEHERVEIACSGGRGRTGTALAVMAVLSGVAPTDAVAWIRSRYHHRAVETSWQRRWIERLDLSQIHQA
jgi:protein-tyrosine phosphatase